MICEKKSDYWKIQRFEPEKIAGTEDRRTNSRKQTVGFPSEDGIGMNKKKSTYFIKTKWFREILSCSSDGSRRSLSVPWHQ